MIKNPKILEKFEKEIVRKERVDINRNFKLVEEMYKEAAEMGIIPLRNPLDGIETVIKIAKTVNNV